MQGDQPAEEKRAAAPYSLLVKCGRKPLPSFMRQQLSSRSARQSGCRENRVRQVVRNRLRSITLRPYYQGRYDPSGRSIKVPHTVEVNCIL